MCFSASASFSAGVILSAVGIATLKKVKKKYQLPFAGIPIVFAAQQITEGFLWLALQEPFSSSLGRVTTYLFLFFAQVVWPAWAPFSIYSTETGTRQKKRLKVLVAVGIVVSLYLAYCLFNYPVKARIVGHHISYEQDYPAALSRYGGFLYIVATILPPFLSSLKRMNFLGFAILVSYLVTAIFYEGYIVSVWCFFASIISIVVYAIMREVRHLPE
jgi:hypothetical protein